MATDSEGGEATIGDCIRGGFREGERLENVKRKRLMEGDSDVQSYGISLKALMLGLLRVGSKHLSSISSHPSYGRDKNLQGS